MTIAWPTKMKIHTKGQIWCQSRSDGSVWDVHLWESQPSRKSGVSIMLKTKFMYHRIEGMRKEVHELVQWCLKRRVSLGHFINSVGEKPNLQPFWLHNTRMNQSPVGNSDKEGNGRRHVLRRGEVCCGNSAHLSPQDPRRAYRGKVVNCHPTLNAWNIPFKWRSSPTSTCPLPKGPARHVGCSG